MSDSDTLLAGFVTDCKLRRLATFDNYRTTARFFLRWLDSQGIDPLQVNKDVLKGYLVYLQDRNLSNSSIKIAFIKIGTFYNYLQDDGKVLLNPIPAFSKRYLAVYKAQEPAKKRLLSVEEAARLVTSTLDTRDRAILLLLLKTGIRRHELTALDVGDVDLDSMSIQLKPTPKRSNRQVFFDYETADVLRRWLHARSLRDVKDQSLFPSYMGSRIRSEEIRNITQKHAKRCGLLESNGGEKFGAHACRHWFTTHLLRAGMRREYVQWLRGDAIKEAVDIYFHIDPKDVKENYLACIPQLGV